MNSTRYTSNHKLSYGEELALYRGTGATPILDEASAPWTYVLPGVTVTDEEIAGILASATDAVEPPQFYEPFALDDIFVERPRKYEPKVVEIGGQNEDGAVLSGAPGEREEFDIDKIDWGAGSPPPVLWEMTCVSEERVRSVWNAWSDARTQIVNPYLHDDRRLNVYDEMYEKDGKYARKVVNYPNGATTTIEIARMNHGARWDFLAVMFVDGGLDGMYNISLYKPGEEEVGNLAGEMIFLLSEARAGRIVEDDSAMSVREFGAAIAEIAGLPDGFWNDVEEVYE